MTYAAHWREHVLPRVHERARFYAISVVFGHIDDPTTPLRDLSYAEALDQTMAYALSWGAHRLPDQVLRDLEDHIAAMILATIDKLETSNGR